MKEDTVLAIKVIPKASRTEIVGWEGGEIKVRLAAVPEKGRANQEIIRFFAKLLKIAKREVQIVSGEQSRHKKVRILGLSKSEVLVQLSLLKKEE